ncbi:uncharacterized protein CC84DRAFT_1240023 [Paraphaeosphaeria sporulosa]|uniref:Zn(2)-C6 fungal-type domain-containing protein n=1 Tax=Paraphaeosphaeria sporulosa TaxID=1460663 RepID=A0A177CPF8_9PLEO|nr:uncharacterized protein CC84DRAFT_1240023 [Paraphaeosphaeria sporulosa]OAG08657.1 hypothetical protein CC84DRAFT_1240023 [Paraphaeosphaeria sporulosa]
MKQTVCDRCHGQKLKCEFANGGTGDSCKRCTRAGAKCTYPTYEECVPNQIEDQGRPNAAQNQMTNARGTNRSESLPTHPRLNSHRHRSFTTLASPRLDRGPSQAQMSRKRLRSSMEGLASSYPYPMTTASEQSLDAALSQEALDHVATAPAHDVLNIPFDFTWSDVEILQLDGLASDSLREAYPDGSPRYMPHLHDRSDGPVSVAVVGSYEGLY